MKIYLAYSSERDRSRKEKLAVSAFSREWKQLELFALKKPETVVFVRPDESGFDDLVLAIKRVGVRHIVDIRDVPYLNFSGGTRDRFFEALATLQIDYQGVHPLIHEEGLESLSSLLDQSKDAETKSERALDSFLKTRISRGPTMVFCDLSPREDLKVGSLLDFFSKKRYEYAPVLALEEAEGNASAS